MSPSPLTPPPGLRDVAGGADQAMEPASASIDWSPWYLTYEDDVGQSPEHDAVVQQFSSALRELLRLRDWKHLRVGMDHFFAWMPSEPNVRVSPDVFLAERQPEDVSDHRMWCTWKRGHVPPWFALEVVSEDDWKKDYEDNPTKYALLGAQELLLYDSGVRESRLHRRQPLQVYRREPDGRFVKAAQGARSVQLATLEVWAVVVSAPDYAHPLLRLAFDGEGRHLVATERERGDQEAHARQAAEAQAEQAETRAEREVHARQQAETRAEREVHARQQAEGEIAKLRAELERLRSSPR